VTPYAAALPFAPAGGHADPILRYGRLELDTRSGRVSRDGNPVTLTAMEYRILAYMTHQRHRIISQSGIVEHVYAQDYDRDSNTIEVMVDRLRKKLGKDSIVTVRGLGYGLGYGLGEPA
jgi:two-component system, OmpR family, response regulator